MTCLWGTMGGCGVYTDSLDLSGNLTTLFEQEEYHMAIKLNV
jgi:hypothetical protein